MRGRSLRSCDCSIAFFLLSFPHCKHKKNFPRQHFPYQWPSLGFESRWPHTLPPPRGKATGRKREEETARVSSQRPDKHCRGTPTADFGGEFGRFSWSGGTRALGSWATDRETNPGSPLPRSSSFGPSDVDSLDSPLYATLPNTPLTGDSRPSRPAFEEPGRASEPPAPLFIGRKMGSSVSPVLGGLHMLCTSHCVW